MSQPNANAPDSQQGGHNPSSPVERFLHAERPGFRILEQRIPAQQQVPWHYHTGVRDVFYILQGQVRLSLRSPEEEILLAPGDTFTVAIRRPHRVTNAGEGLAIIFVLQAGPYDFVPVP